jgi:hypothetical protein
MEISRFDTTDSMMQYFGQLSFSFEENKRNELNRSGFASIGAPC